MTASRIAGCILGTAVGDALGLTYEGLSPQRAARMLGPPDRYRFCFGYGLVSDDTEHTCLTAQALAASGGDVEVFRRDLARRLRWWLLGLPAGVGLATLRAVLKLWLGWSPATSGVFSAGNGPAMRAAVIGAAIANEMQLREFVRASTRLTHSDPKAEVAAYAVALAARIGCEERHVSGTTYLARLQATFDSADEELLALIERAIDSANAGQSTEAFAMSLGLERGVTGYVYHTVPVVLHAWFIHPTDYRAAITSIIRCGGDADSTAAILGGIIGAAEGRESIPTEWISHLITWPANEVWLRSVSEQAAALRSMKTTALNPFAVLLRNVGFLAVVLFHGFRRLLPPW